MSRDRGTGQQGSALVIALLVAFILSLLGVSFLMMAQQESRIARNETLATQALYVAEAGVRAVQHWFDRPGGPIDFPLVTEVDRTRRWIVDETDPYDPIDATPQDGSASAPRYKQASGALFDRPYRGGLEDTFLGMEAQPDIRIDEAGQPLEQAFLDRLSDTLVGDFPREGAALEARIARIDVYAPPYVETPSGWNRYGIATVKVTAKIYNRFDGANQMLAQREVRAVLNEIPYDRAFGTLHSCGDLVFPGTLPAHWGAVTATGSIFPDDPDDVPVTVPRALPPVARMDLLWAAAAAEVNDYMSNVDTSDPIPDPWTRVLGGGPIAGEAAGEQPFPPVPFGGPPPWPCCDKSNRIQSSFRVSCPGYDYELWRNLALSGARGAHYYTDAGGGLFREDGVGTPESFEAITSGRQGLFFFDTQDGRPPLDTDFDGVPDNLTTPVVTVSSTWTSGGFIYLNAVGFETSASGVAAGPSTTMNAPGEPYLDVDGDARFAAPPDVWINLVYPTNLTDPFTADPFDGFGGGVSRNAAGPDIDAPVSFHGVFFTTGSVRITGPGTFYGSVIGQGNVDLLTPPPRLYRDGAIDGNWPPAGMALPRVFVGSWLNRP